MKHIGCEDGLTVGVHVSRGRRVTLEFDGERRHLSVAAWRRLCDLVDDALVEPAKRGREAGKSANTRPRPSRRRHNPVTVKDLVDNGVIPATARLTFKNAPHVEAVVDTDGMIEYNGIRYDSPSAAATAVTGRTHNGWDVWLCADEPLSALRARHTEWTAAYHSGTPDAHPEAG